MPSLPRCVVGKWASTLDDADLLAWAKAIREISRVDLLAKICAAAGEQPFALTALKDHINGRCVCH